MNVWQYQSKAEPVFVPSPDAATATVDKWQPICPSPVRRPFGVAASAIALFFVSAPSVATPFDWQQPISKPIARVQPRIQGGTFAPVMAIQNIVMPDMWYQPAAMPVRTPARSPPDTSVFPLPVPTSIASLDWLQPTSQPVQSPKRSAIGAFVLEPFPRPSAEAPFDWTQPIHQPYPRIPARAAIGQFAFDPFALPNQSLPTVAWYQPTNQPAMIPVKIRQFGSIFYVEFTDKASAPIFLIGLS